MHMCKGKKKEESLDEVLQVKEAINEEKAMYAQHNHQGRGGRFGGCGPGRGRGREKENNYHERQQPNESQQSFRGRGCGCGRGGRIYHPNVDCYNCGKHGHYAKNCRFTRNIEENMNLVTEEEVKENGVLMLAYDDAIPNSDAMWYLDTGASNLMCGRKHLFVEMQEIEDGHVSFGDALKI